MIRTQTRDVRSASSTTFLFTLMAALLCGLVAATPALADVEGMPAPEPVARLLASTGSGSDAPSTHPTYEKGQPATVSTFDDLQYANAAQANPITLASDFDTSGPSPLGIYYAMTLDLNGQTMDLGSEAFIYIGTADGHGPGSLTLTGSGTITAANGGPTIEVNGSGSALTLEGPTVECTGTDGVAVGFWGTDATFTMTSGEISAPQATGLTINGQASGMSFDISGGTISGFNAIYLSGEGTTTISGSAIVTSNDLAISIRNGTLNVEGGTISTTANHATEYRSSPDGSTVAFAAIAVSNDTTASVGGTGGKSVTLNVTGGTITAPSVATALYVTNKDTLSSGGANTSGTTNAVTLSGGTVSGTIVNADIAPTGASAATTPTLTLSGATVKGDVVTDPTVGDIASATYAAGGVTQVSAPTTVTGNVENVQGSTSVGASGAAGPTINGSYSNSAKTGSGTATFYSGTVTQGFTEATATQPGITVPSSVAGDLVKATYTSGSSSSSANAIGTSPLNLSDIPDNSKITVTAAPAKAVVDMPESSTITNSSPTNSITAQAPDGSATTVDANGGSSATPTPPAPAPKPPTARQLLQETVDGALETPGTVNEDAYTDVTWSAYQSALLSAQSLLQNEAAPASQLSDARQALETAIADLVELTPALDQLQEAVASAVKTAGTNGSVYTTATWTAYQRALAAANVLLADPEGTDAQVTAATQALQSAVDGLVSEYVAIYRLYNPYSDLHLYSTSETEVEQLTADGWQNEGIYWYAPAEGPGTYTILRLYNPYNGDHYYVPMSELGETNRLLNMGWRLDSPASWFQSAPAGSQYPVYTLFNPYAKVDTHLWTPYQNEVRTLERDGWEPNATVIWAAMLP